MNIDADGEKDPPDERNVVHGVNEVGTSGAGSGLQGTHTLQVQHKQQQPQPTTVCWARFLHVESIRVLLVENDDSTRHIVTALLRNCNYEVLGAANGLQAWKVLEDLNNRVDLVLTEVVMPFLPGIPLLSKIMSHKTRKNVPVIMMSSHDSMGLVFKCLSKGAVDFLVKPIRKNELKNLWQHVWRRCHSSSGSGSESGTHTQKSVKSKSSDKSDNSGSDDGENDMSNGLNGGDGSDDGSGTQSSWTKQALEVESSQALSPIDPVAECQDSTCAQVIRSNAENSSYKRVHYSVARGDHDEQRPDNIAEVKDLEAMTSRNVEPKARQTMENPVANDPKLKPVVELDRNTSVNQKDMGQDNSTAECKFNRHKGSIYETCNFLIDGRESDSTREGTNIWETNNNEEPNLELSLKRHRGAPDTERSSQEERFVLRRSEQSAFSRYNTSSNIFKPPNGNTRCSSMIDNCPEVAKLESVRGTRGHSTDHHVHLRSNGVSNNLDMGSTTDKLPKYPSSMKDESETTSAINGIHPSAFRPVKHDARYGPPQASLLHGEIQATDLSGLQQDHQTHHPQHNNFHHNHHRFHNSEQPSSNNGESSSKKLAVDTPPHCGSTTAVGEAMDSNPKDYSLNRSASGSNHVSNVHNGSSNAVNAAGANPESDAGQAGKSGSGDGSGSGSGNKIDDDKIARRIAALSKFRQKKKDRCFAKKVRYHNRKKLAEQRPRVRGQFVKQTGTDSSNKNSDE